MLSLETQIQIVVLMCKYQSEIQVSRDLRKQGLINVPSRPTINIIYSKFLQYGSDNETSIEYYRSTWKNQWAH